MQNNIFKPITRDERQEQARVKWIKNKCNGVFEFPTGTGKTKTALKCLKSVLDKYPSLRVLVVVPTTTLKEQWEPQLDEWGLLFNAEVQVINTVVKHTWNADILVIDECHRYASELFKEIFERVKYKYILGLTATFERLDGKHELIEKYCPIIDKISTLEALANGWISEFKEYEILINVDNIDEYKQYNKEFIKHFEFFSFDWNLATSCIGKKGFMTRCKLRDKICPSNSETEKKKAMSLITMHAIAFMRAVQKRKAFVNKHPDKIRITKKIIDARSDSKIVTFSNNVKMAESIGYGPVYTGKDSKKKGRITMEEFKNADYGVINSAKKLVEGADIPRLSVAIVLGHDSSSTRAIQTRGRVIRKEGDKVAEIFNIVINDTIETKWFQKSHEHSPYTIIDEEGLDAVLKGETPKPYTKKIKDFQFRF